MVCAGHSLGEIEVIDGSTALANAVAVEPSHGWKMTKSNALHAIQTIPAFSQLLLRGLARAAKLSQQVYLHSLFLTPEQRLVLVLLNMAHGQSPSDKAPVVVPLTQEQMCQFANVSRQFVSQRLSTWVEKGWLATRYRRIELLEPQSLKNLLGGNVHPAMLSLLTREAQ